MIAFIYLNRIKIHNLLILSSKNVLNTVVKIIKKLKKKRKEKMLILNKIIQYNYKKVKKQTLVVNLVNLKFH